MKLSTSTRISLWYAFLSVVIVGLFGAGVMSFFSSHWQRAEKQLLRLPPKTVEKLEHQPLAQRFLHTVVLDKDDAQRRFLSDMHQKQGLIEHENKRFMYRMDDDKVIVRDVTMQVQRQYYLMRLLFWGLLLSALVSFGLGKVFVRRALRDLRVLSKKVEQIDIDALHFAHALDHLPEHDEIRMIAETLEDMSGTLQTQVSDMRQFVSNVSHELRTPLMILRSTSEVAMKTEQYKEHMPKIQTTVDQMEGLISTLLMLARSETNGFEKQEVNPEEVFLGVLEQVKQKYTEKDIEVSLDMHLARSVLAHRGSLERIVHNLLDNAYKYSGEGGVIEIVVDDAGFSITDTGPGIEEEDFERMWQPFWQADESRGEDTGFGLGLALVRRLVALHDWEIGVESEVGVGSRFSVYR